jgi:hypothetical protein
MNQSERIIKFCLLARAGLSLGLGFLLALALDESADRGFEREERALRARNRNFTAGKRPSRDDVHRRD